MNRVPCKSIMIVEDDDGIRDALRMALEMEGYAVLTAANGKEGLDLLPQAERPCLILLDLMMPVMNGWEFAEALNSNLVLATIPIVVVTAFSEQAKKMPVAKRVVKKPIDIDMLLNLVKGYCA